MYFRYPGGKSRGAVREAIAVNLQTYAHQNWLEYREPFLGGGSVVCKFLKDHPKWEFVWINDLDPAIAAAWNALIHHPEELVELVMEFKPSVEEFWRLKKELSSPEFVASCPTLDLGFRKMALHRISYAGLGVMAGGPIGGKSQTSKYPVGCRWNATTLCKNIRRLHKRFSQLSIREGQCTSLDFEEIIKPRGDAVIYLDPPYYVQGDTLYFHAFSDKDHTRLAQVLSETEHPWVMTYNDCPEMRSLYHWAHIESVNVKYSLTASKNKQTGKRQSNAKSELLICSRNHKEIVDVIQRK